MTFRTTLLTYLVWGAKSQSAAPATQNGGPPSACRLTPSPFREHQMLPLPGNRALAVTKCCPCFSTQNHKLLRLQRKTAIARLRGRGAISCSLKGLGVSLSALGGHLFCVAGSAVVTLGAKIVAGATSRDRQCTIAWQPKQPQTPKSFATLSALEKGSPQLLSWQSFGRRKFGRGRAPRGLDAVQVDRAAVSHRGLTHRQI